MTSRNHITGQTEQPDPFSAMFGELKKAVGMDAAVEAVHGYRKAEDYPKMTLAEARAKRLGLDAAAPNPAPKPAKRVVRFVIRTRIGAKWTKNAKKNRLKSRVWVKNPRKGDFFRIGALTSHA